MSDAFDVFDPFEPLEAAGEHEGEGSAGEERATGSSEPARERAARRWSAPAARPTPPSSDAERTRAQARPEAPTRRLPTGADFEDALDAVLFGPRGPEADGSTGGGSEGGHTSSPALVPADDLAAFRAAALPELESAVERLSARGHLASLADDLGQREPAVVVRFRPNQGPLAAFGSTAREPARFELRLAVDLDGETQVVAGYTLGAPDAPFTLLSRARISAVRADWVAQRFLDFVRRVLTLD